MTIYFFTSLYPVILSISSTANGAKIANIAAVLFVIPIKVPACIGDKSIWFRSMPQLVPALEETASTRKNITSSLLLVPTRHRQMSDMPGMNKPKI